MPQGQAAPGLENAVLTEGAGGGGCPSPDKAHAPVEEGIRCYADIHRTRKNREGYKITYTFDGKEFRHVDNPEDIPLCIGDRLYVDTVPITHTDAFIQLLRNGVEVYCLRRLTLLEKVRNDLKLPKTTRGDIRTLMNIGERWFRKVSEDFLVMRRMISTYRIMLKMRQQCLNRYKAVSEIEKGRLKPIIEVLDEQTEKLANEIIEEAIKRYQPFNKLVEALGIGKSLTAKESLAELMTYIDLTYSWTKIRNYLGMWKRDRKTRYHKSKTARQALERLTITIKAHRMKGRDLEEILKTIWTTLRTQKTGPPA